MELRVSFSGCDEIIKKSLLFIRKRLSKRLKVNEKRNSNDESRKCIFPLDVDDDNFCIVVNKCK